MGFFERVKAAAKKFYPFGKKKGKEKEPVADDLGSEEPIFVDIEAVDFDTDDYAIDVTETFLVGKKKYTVQNQSIISAMRAHTVGTGKDKPSIEKLVVTGELTQEDILFLGAKKEIKSIEFTGYDDPSDSPYSDEQSPKLKGLNLRPLADKNSISLDGHVYEEGSDKNKLLDFLSSKEKGPYPNPTPIKFEGFTLSNPQLLRFYREGQHKDQLRLDFYYDDSSTGIDESKLTSGDISFIAKEMPQLERLSISNRNRYFQSAVTKSELEDISKLQNLVFLGFEGSTFAQGAKLSEYIGSFPKLNKLFIDRSNIEPEELLAIAENAPDTLQILYDNKTLTPEQIKKKYGEISGDVSPTVSRGDAPPPPATATAIDELLSVLDNLSSLPPLYGDDFLDSPADLDAELYPRTSAIAKSPRYALTVNNGNKPVAATLIPEEQLKDKINAAFESVTTVTKKNGEEVIVSDRTNKGNATSKKDLSAITLSDKNKGLLKDLLSENLKSDEIKLSGKVMIYKPGDDGKTKAPAEKLYLKILKPLSDPKNLDLFKTLEAEGFNPIRMKGDKGYMIAGISNDAALKIFSEVAAMIVEKGKASSVDRGAVIT